MLLTNALDARRVAANGLLAPLYDSLAAELDPVLARPLHVPDQKALLSRAGGRCAKCGATLEFDPFSPHEHRCATCGATHRGDYHDRWWVTWYQLWLAERAVHAALFHTLRGEARYRDFAARLLHEYADRYALYPNADNVLGPTRLFFSTYLESIWLLNICVATDLLEHAGDTGTANVVRDRIVAPSRELIAGFDEGMSNRQVWNNVALLASALILRRRDLAEQVLRGKSGIEAHLTRALLSDGTWFEGDNYHQFAVRGLWYAVTMCEAAGLPLSSAAITAFDRGVAASFAGALPDFTFPSRKDSQYAVSLRQWRFAELAELGFARTRDNALGVALARCYEPGPARGDTGRARSTADAERNSPSVALTRADLGWRALLHALPELPPLAPGEPGSVHFAGQGYAVFRRRGDVYVGVDYGQSGAGHGHPDRLNLTLYQGNSRWLDDLGTGSYVDTSLHWYRSTLAHNAPLLFGRSQGGGGGRLVAYEEREEFGWIQATLVEAGHLITRTIVVADGYLIDDVRIERTGTDLVNFRLDDAPPLPSPDVDLPYHLDAVSESIAFEPAEMKGGTGLEDGFDFTSSWARGVVRSGGGRLVAANGVQRLTLDVDSGTQLWRALGPGQPASKLTPFYIVRFPHTHRAVIAWDAPVTAAFGRDAVTVVTRGERHEHRATESGWRVDISRGWRRLWRRSSVSLGGRRRESDPIQSGPPVLAGREDSTFADWRSVALDGERRVSFVLGERNYRRSEIPWQDAGAPRARVEATASRSRVSITVEVHAARQRFAAADAVNDFDNEHPDTMGAGVQLYLGHSRGRAMWVLVPASAGHVRIRPVVGSAHEGARIDATWTPGADGYVVRATVTGLTADAWFLGVVVNDAVDGRVRRRGQLVTADATGQFVYLRGDRADLSDSICLDVP